tara:strand:+ start:118 stop:663 length:546 start_codon:yes stop_codon:yes gene_type:complete
MSLSMVNSLTSFEARRTFKVLATELFSSSDGIDMPQGNPVEGMPKADWTVGTGATLDYYLGYLTVASDGTGGRFASYTFSVIPNTTYKYEFEISATTNLAGASGGGSVTTIMVGTEADDGSYLDINNADATLTGSFTVGNTSNTAFLTIHIEDASRKAWINHLHIWEEGFTSSEVVGTMIK